MNKRIVTQGLVAEVEHCVGCEIMHLHIGAFTLRMKPAALHDLRDTLSRALETLPANGNETAIQHAATEQSSGGSCH